MAKIKYSDLADENIFANLIKDSAILAENLDLVKKRLQDTGKEIKSKLNVKLDESNMEQFIANTEKLKVNTQHLNEVKKQETILTQAQTQAQKLQDNVDKTQEGSRNRLVAVTAKLRHELNNLNQSTVEGAKKAQLLKTQIDANDKSIATMGDTLSKNRMNVGNYTESIREATRHMGFFGEIIEKIVVIQETLKRILESSAHAQQAETVATELNTVAEKENIATDKIAIAVSEEHTVKIEAETIAMKAKGLATKGAVAIMLIALAGLVEGMRKSESATDTFKENWAGIKGVWDAFSQNMKNLVTGDWDKFQKMVGGNSAFTKAKEEAKALDELEEHEIDLIVIQAKRRALSAKDRLSVEQDVLTIKEKIRLLKESEEQITKNSEEEIHASKKRAEIHEGEMIRLGATQKQLDDLKEGKPMDATADISRDLIKEQQELYAHTIDLQTEHDLEIRRVAKKIKMLMLEDENDILAVSDFNVKARTSVITDSFKKQSELEEERFKQAIAKAKQHNRFTIIEEKGLSGQKLKDAQDNNKLHYESLELLEKEHNRNVELIGIEHNKRIYDIKKEYDKSVFDETVHSSEDIKKYEIWQLEKDVAFQKKYGDKKLENFEKNLKLMENMVIKSKNELDKLQFDNFMTIRQSNEDVHKSEKQLNDFTWKEKRKTILEEYDFKIETAAKFYLQQNTLYKAGSVQEKEAYNKWKLAKLEKDIYLKEERKKQITDLAQAVSQATEFTLNQFIKANQTKMAMLDMEFEASKNHEETLRAMAQSRTEGALNNLAFEQKRQAEIQKEKMKMLRDQLKMEEAIQAVKLLDSIVNKGINGQQSGIGSIGSLLSGIKGFETGGLVEGGEQFIRINEKGTEFVANAEATKVYQPILNDINNLQFNPMKYLPMAQAYNDDAKSNPMVKKLDNIDNSIKNLPVLDSAKINELAKCVEYQFKQGQTRFITHVRNSLV